MPWLLTLPQENVLTMAIAFMNIDGRNVYIYIHKIKAIQYIAGMDKQMPALLMT